MHANKASGNHLSKYSIPSLPLQVSETNFIMPGTSDPTPSLDTSASTIKRPLPGGSAKSSWAGSAGSKFKSVLNKLRHGPRPTGTTSSSDKQNKEKKKGDGKTSSQWGPKRDQYASEMRLHF